MRPNGCWPTPRGLLRKAKINAEKQKVNGRCDAVTGRRRGRLVRAVNDLTELLDATRKIVEQTRERLDGRIPDGATRQVSLHDPDARPIRKGRLGKPVEFAPGVEPGPVGESGRGEAAAVQSDPG
jgi:IS5 family transposase